jgi:hypothetical protein
MIHDDDKTIIIVHPSCDILDRNINIVTPKKNQKIRTSISDKNY